MKNQEQKNKNKYLLLLVLLIIAVAAFWYFYHSKKEKGFVFTPQGKTEITEGNMTLKIWDASAEDGDTVQVYFQKKMLMDTLGILNKEDVFRLGHLSAGRYWLGVRALSEGMNSPATAAMSISNGNEEQIFSMDAWIDSAASWELIVTEKK